MQYLRIMNQGTCDYRCFTLLGVSTSRGEDSKIGQFGSGAKFGTMALLRSNISPVVYVGNLKMDFGFRPIEIDSREFRQAIINLSGKNADGIQVKRTEELSYTLEHGIYDWKNLFMGLREYVSNAIDGSVENTGSYKNVVIDIVDNMRAKAGHTQVYIPLTQDVRAFLDILGDWFLHFSKKFTPKTEIMEKDKPGPAKIYYRGVLIRTIGEDSCFDYNVSNLTLDESRNSNDWDVRCAVVDSLAKTQNKKYLRKVLRNSIENPRMFESTISQWQWNAHKNELADAFEEEFGKSAVLCSEVTESHIKSKGLIPIQLNSDFVSVLRTVERLKTDTKVLDHAECEGFTVRAATGNIIECFDKVWSTFEYLGLTADKKKPEVKSMFKPMGCDGSKTKGMYKGGVVYVDEHLGGIELTQTVVEEICHHTTGASDASRALQEHAFLMIAKMID